MSRLKALLIAAPVAVSLLAVPSAHAEWRGHGGGYGGGGDSHGYGHGGGHYQPQRYYRHGGGNGPLVGALVGLGALAVVGGVIAAQQPQYYAPPPVVYAPPPPVA